MRKHANCYYPQLPRVILSSSVVADMVEMIPASCICSFPARLWGSLPPYHQFNRISTGLHGRACSSLSPILVLPAKPIISPRRTRCSAAQPVIENDSFDSAASAVVGSDPPLAIKKRASEISSDLRGTSIFLIGITSSYKLNLGRILASVLRYYYFDSDSLVEEVAGGKTAAMSYIESDEEGYRASETEVLKQLSSMGRLVVCTGNGAVKNATNLASLRHGISIWIDVPLDVVTRDILEDRIQFSASDALLCRSLSEVEDQVATLYDSARSGYSTADATISLQKVASELGLDYHELDKVTAEDFCMEVLNEIERLIRVKKMIEEAARPF